MRLKLSRKNLLIGLSLLAFCGLAAGALIMWLLGWVFLTGVIMNEFFCTDAVSNAFPYCGQTFHYGKLALIIIVGVVLLILFSRRVLKGFFFTPSDWSEKLKTGHRQKIMTEILSLWIICGLSLIILFMWLYGWFVLQNMWIMGIWCSENLYAEPSYCDHALYYGKAAVLVLFGVAMPLYFLRRILKGRN